MTGIATLVVMSVLTTHASAIERHDISRMSCNAAGQPLSWSKPPFCGTPPQEN